MAHGEIEKVDNRIAIGEDDQPYGGSVVGLQYSISFQGPSSLSATIANNSGKYSTPNLNSTKPVLVEFGICKMNMLATSYRKSKGSGGRTLTVNFDDMGLYYLDKTTILLKYQHLEEARGGATLVLGVLFADDKNGVSRRYFGKFKSGLTQVQYDIRDIAVAMDEHGIPISEAFYQYLHNFKAYIKGDEKVDAPSSFLRSDVGSLRSVLSAVGNELGFVSFWNNDDGIRETGTKEIVRNNKDREGFLDFVRFESAVDFDKINETVEEFTESCNVLDDSYEVSIKDSYLKGGIGLFTVTPPSVDGRSEKFSRFKFQEKVTSAYNFTDAPANTRPESVDIKKNYGLELLMRASLMGADFYKKYVLQKLTASYIEDNEDLMLKPATQFNTMALRNQPEEQVNGEKFGIDQNFGTYISRGVRHESTKEFPFNIVRNTAVDDLYKGDQFELIPCVYSKYFDRPEMQTVQEGTWQELYPDVRPPFREAIASDARWSTIFDDEGFIKNLKAPFNFRKDDVDASEFIGISYKATEAFKTFIDDVESDPVYIQIRFLAETYGTIYFKGTRTSNKLITQELFNRRNYAANVEWVFSDTAAFDTSVGNIFSFTQNERVKGKVDGESIYKDRGDYEIHKQGQSVCGRPTEIPSNMLSPQERLYVVGEDNLNGINNPTEDQAESAKAFVDVMGIYTFLGKTTSIIQKSSGTPKATGCTAGQDEEGDSETLYEVDVVAEPPFDKAQERLDNGFVLETFVRKSNVELDFGAADPLTVRTAGKSITNEHYQALQSYRTSCDTEIHPQERLTTPAKKFAGETPDREAQFNYPTDLDYGVVIHDAGEGGEVAGGDTAMSYSVYTKSNDMPATDMWYNQSGQYLALEAVQWEVDRDFESIWGRKDADYWDAQLLEGVKMNVPLKNVSDKKILSYAYTVDDMLQSVRASYVAKSSSEVFDAVSRIEVEEVNFDIGSLLNLDNYRYEFKTCEEGEEIDLVTATENLYDIMANYVELNSSPSISRDFVVSGYGFKRDATADEELPSIYQGLESISMDLSENGIQTTVKIGNKRRMRAAAQLRAQMIVKGMAGSSSSRSVPNQVNNSFSTGLQAKF